MARLHATDKKDTGSVWAMVSWRLVPFFAVCVVALSIWQAEVLSETNDATMIARLNNPVAAETLGD
jgi:hypothetical protein